MKQTDTVNRRIVLASRPQGAVSAENFRLETLPLPAIDQGQILLRTVMLSVDPYMRGRMDKTRSYTKPVDVGGVMFGGTVCKVAQSRHPDYREGDLLHGFTGWQDYAISDGRRLLRLDPPPIKSPVKSRIKPSHALGALGLPGFTAYAGLTDIGNPKPGETLVVGAATGAVGSMVGQLAKLRGCRTVGIAGSPEKCEHAVKELGFDACINHRQGDLLWQLREACPDGIDIYFENLGGEVLYAVMPQLNVGARVPVCGLISYYDRDAHAGVDHAPLILSSLLVKRVRMQGFIFDDYFDAFGPRFMAFFQEMSGLLADGKIKTLEHVVDGLESAPVALMRQLKGDNFGKVIVNVGPM
jgi:hypothetical protein